LIVIIVVVIVIAIPVMIAEIGLSHLVSLSHCFLIGYGCCLAIIKGSMIKHRLGAFTKGRDRCRMESQCESPFGKNGRRVNRSVEKQFDLWKRLLPNSHRFSTVNRSLQ